MSLPSGDDTGSLGQMRASLYSPRSTKRERAPLAMARDRSFPHEWKEEEKSTKETQLPEPHTRHHSMRTATIFLSIAVFFFFVSLVIAGYFFYFGSNSVSVDKVAINVQGPTTIAGGDTVPLSITIINKNPVTIDNATIEIDFPTGTRNAENVLSAYPRYIENVGTLAPGATITRSVKAVIFGGAGQTVALPISFSYSTANSNAVFEKKSSYALAISSTPLSVSVESLSETVSGEPITFTLVVRSNATVSLSNVIVATALPFGFLTTSSSMPLTNGSFFIGSLAPGASKQITLTGTLSGQNGDERVFHFTVGTAKSATNPALAVTYMTQDASVTIAQPFIATTLALNNDTSSKAVISPGSIQTVNLSYKNTLATTVSNVTVVVTIAGSAVDYSSIKTSNGFYNSVDHTIVFSQDTDPALASLVPGASGIGAFTFSTLGAGSPSPNVTFSVAVSGVRVGQSNVPEQIATSVVKTVKVATTVQFSATTMHASGGLSTSGPIPPRAEQATTYNVSWNVQNLGSAIAGGVVSATLPSYVTYTERTTGSGVFSYDVANHRVSWSVGDIAQGASAQGIFQVAIIPSTSQQKGSPQLTNGATFSGYDRYAGVQISASADPVTTEPSGDTGYVPGSGTVQ